MFLGTSQSISIILRPKAFVPMYVLMKPVNVSFIQTYSLLNFKFEQLNHRMHYSVFIKKHLTLLSSDFKGSVPFQCLVILFEMSL